MNRKSFKHIIVINTFLMLIGIIELFTLKAGWSVVALVFLYLGLTELSQQQYDSFKRKCDVLFDPFLRNRYNRKYYKFCPAANIVPYTRAERRLLIKRISVIFLGIIVNVGAWSIILVALQSLTSTPTTGHLVGLAPLFMFISALTVALMFNLFPKKR